MKLLLLRCPNCQEPLHPQDNDILVACTNCFTPISLDESGVKIATVNYATVKEGVSSTSITWLPFWVTTGRVNITSRKTQGSNRRALSESQAMWSAVRTFYIPAIDLSIPDMRHLGSRLLHQQPVLNAAPASDGIPFTAANVTAEDAMQLLEMIILTIEAERKDWLKDLKFQIEAPPPQLWIVPTQANKITFLTA